MANQRSSSACAWNLLPNPMQSHGGDSPEPPGQGSPQGRPSAPWQMRVY